MLIHSLPDGAKPDRVVLLGAGGFVAPELRRVLEEDGIPVRALGSKTLDLTSADAGSELAAQLRPNDVVVMAAALTPDKGRDASTMMKNLRMGENVCIAIARTQTAHFMYISTDGVYDTRSSLLKEDSTCEPSDLYALAHIGRERMLEQTCRTAGLPLAIVRPCAIYGPGDTHNSYGPNRFIRTAKNDGKITLFGGGEERRHHIHVTDVAKILKLCILHRSSGTINAATGEAVSFRDVARFVIEASHGPVALECLTRANPITHRHFDLSGLAKAFPQFSAIPLRAGVASATVQA